MTDSDKIIFPKSNESWGTIDHAVLSYNKKKNFIRKLWDKFLNLFNIETDDCDAIYLDFNYPKDLK
jgi:hypothetical protein